MTTMRFATHIKADPKKTFAAFADLRNAPQRVSAIKRMEVLTEGPIRKGTRFKETRIMFNRECTEEMEVADFQPDQFYTISGNSCGLAWSSTFRFVPDAAGTRVELEMNCRPLTFFAKLMSPLGKLMAGSMKKCVEKDMEELRKWVEANSASAY